MKLDIVNCSQYTTCDECLKPISGGGDPFCGWCIREDRQVAFDTTLNVLNVLLR